MSSFLKCAFNTSAVQGTGANVGVLFLRVAVGSMMLFGHGYGKLANFDTYSTQFGDPIGLGPQLSLIFAIFAEFFCSIAILFGFATRLAAIPLLITMSVAALIVHASDPWQRQEFALLYAVIYVTLLLVGSGRYSLDHAIATRLESGQKVPLAEL